MSLAMVLPEDGRIIGCDIKEEVVNIGRPIWKEVSVPCSKKAIGIFRSNS